MVEKLLKQEERELDEIPTRKFDELYSKFLQFILNGSLVLLGIFLTGILAYLSFEMFAKFYHYFLDEEVKGLNISLILQEILEFFLVFEILVTISKYFSSNHHFPLRYLIYIGITAILRSLIIEHNNFQNVVLMAIAILILLLALFVANKISIK